MLLGGSTFTDCHCGMSGEPRLVSVERIGCCSHHDGVCGCEMGRGPLLRWAIEPLLWLRLMTRLWPLLVFLAFLIPVPASTISEYQGEVIRLLDG